MAFDQQSKRGRLGQKKRRKQGNLHESWKESRPLALWFLITGTHATSLDKSWQQDRYKEVTRSWQPRVCRLCWLDLFWLSRRTAAPCSPQTLTTLRGLRKSSSKNAHFWKSRAFCSRAAFSIFDQFSRSNVHNGVGNLESCGAITCHQKSLTPWLCQQVCASKGPICCRLTKTRYKTWSIKMHTSLKTTHLHIRPCRMTW